MLLQISEQQAIYQKSLETLYAKVISFTSDVVATFKQSFDQINSFHKKKQKSQTDLIQNMKKFIDNFQLKSQNQVVEIPSKEQSKLEYQEPQYDLGDLRDYEDQNNSQQQSGQISSPQNDQIADDENEDSNASQQQEEQQQEQNQEKAQVIEVDSNEIVAFKSQETNPKTKYLLVTSKNHRIINYSMTPNITTITLKLLEYDNTKPFRKNQLEILKKYDLSDIESIDLNNQKINDSKLKELTLLPWKNLKSLGLGFNNIKDITPLKNLNLSNFVDLDVSLNSLQAASAHFLAQTQWSSLLYFAISFAKGQNKHCWDILSKKRLQNFCSLESVQIRESEELESIKNDIKNMIQKLEEKQKRQDKKKYGSEYHIKLSFEHSKEYYQRLSNKETSQVYNKWKKELKVSRRTVKTMSVKEYLSSLKRNSNKNSSKTQQKEQKGKIIPMKKTKPIRKSCNPYNRSLKIAGKSASRCLG